MCMHMSVDGFRSQECMGQPHPIGSEAFGMHSVLSPASRLRWLPSAEFSKCKC